MQQREQRENSGILFTNNKRDNPKAPSMRGTAKIAGQYLEISAWTKTDKNGHKFLTLQFQEPRQREERPAQDDEAF